MSQRSRRRAVTALALALTLLVAAPVRAQQPAADRSYGALVEAGDRARAAGDLDGALAHYRQATDASPRPVAALQGQVAVFRAQRRFGRALKRAESLAAFDPEGGRRAQVEVLIDHGDALMEQGPELLTTAAAKYQQALQLQPDDRLALGRLLEALVTAARVEDVERVAASALVAPDDRSELLYWRGRASEAAREIEAARGHYLASLELRPDHGQTLLHLARLAVADRRLDEAREWLERAAERLSASPRALVLEAEVHQGLGDLDAAETCLRQALRISPQHTGALYQHARVLLRLGRREEGLAEMEAFRVAQRAALVVDGD